MIHLVENLDLILKSSSASKFTFKGASSSHKQSEHTCHLPWRAFPGWQARCPSVCRYLKAHWCERLWGNYTLIKCGGNTLEGKISTSTDLTYTIWKGLASCCLEIAIAMASGVHSTGNNGHGLWGNPGALCGFLRRNVILFLCATHTHVHTQAHTPHSNRKHSFLPNHLLKLP